MRRERQDWSMNFYQKKKKREREKEKRDKPTQETHKGSHMILSSRDSKTIFSCVIKCVLLLKTHNIKEQEVKNQERLEKDQSQERKLLVHLLSCLFLHSRSLLRVSWVTDISLRLPTSFLPLFTSLLSLLFLSLFLSPSPSRVYLLPFFLFFISFLEFSVMFFFLSKVCRQMWPTRKRRRLSLLMNNYSCSVFFFLLLLSLTYPLLVLSFTSKTKFCRHKCLWRKGLWVTSKEM